MIFGRGDVRPYPAEKPPDEDDDDCHSVTRNGVMFDDAVDCQMMAPWATGRGW